MKKQQLKKALQLKSATIVNFENLQHVKGGLARPTGESCMEVCDSQNNKICSSYGAEY